MAKAELPFPLKGLNKGMAASKQPPLTSLDMNNVRPYDVDDNRARGGQRPGLKLAYSQRIGGSANYPVVAILQVTTVV
ncbi:hypothetical protein LCGC14_1864250 [marine sediment metagenome]|uniref:Uncharacterized protein n=1 Tax=marine sediment metagenome TaxID=412755 RepID=A0A0F9J5J3_9ZZZZ